MSTAVLTRPWELDSLAERSLESRHAILVCRHPDRTTHLRSRRGFVLRAHRHARRLQVWNKVLTHGYTAGDRLGNAALITHLASAVFIILAGALQLIPRIRNRFPVFHRWIGRLYVVTAFSVSGAGLYLMWVRGTVGDLPQHLGTSLMAVLIMFFAVMALRYAMAHDFKTHRRWALRLYLTVSASLFIRASIFLSFLADQGAFGFDPGTFTGPFLTFISFAQYLVPLAILEIYLRVTDRPGALPRFAMAAALFLVALAMGAGIFGATVGGFLPNIKTALDTRISIAATLSATIAASGIDPAVAQYHNLKSTPASRYNFDENELNALGYQLLAAKKFNEAIRIFQLNIEAYPNSANTYDSLGEAYMDAGDKPQAIANYQKSLQLNPKNANGTAMLKKLRAQ